MTSPQTGLLYLRTNFADDLVTPWQTFFTINYNNFSQLASSWSLSLLGVNFTNGVYNINRYNNVVSVVESGGSTFSFAVTPGNYSDTELGNVLKIALDAGGVHTYTVGGVDPNTGKYTISATGSYRFVAVTNSMYDILGYDIAAQFSAAATTFTGSNPASLGGSQYVDLRMSIGNPLNFVTGGSSSTIALIPITVGFGETNTWTPPEGYPPWTVNGDQLGDIQMSLFSDIGTFWELPPTYHMEIVFAIRPLNDG